MIIGGIKTHTLLRYLLTPDKPATKRSSGDRLAELFRFQKRNQRERETVLSYVANLKKQAAHYIFGANLNEALRDKLACSLRNVQIQKRLLSEAKLQYSKALEIAICDASELQSEIQSKPRVDKITDNSKTPPNTTPNAYY